MTQYTATVAHHSIARHYSININGSLTSAKTAASKEFGAGFLDHRIVIKDQHGQVVASRYIADKRWS